ncbi:MAG: hypothetical protein KGI08_08235 [Thaumarchaeota archaeon]|nr:hypothetical protein [Nitrososphaerota archaeon]
MGKGTPIAIIIAAVLIAGGIAVFYGGNNNNIPQQNLTVPNGAGSQTPTNQVAASNLCPAGQQQSPSNPAVCIPIGQLTITLKEVNALDNTLTLTEGTNLDTIFFKSTDGVTFTNIGSGTGNTITLDPTMKGIIYAQVAAHSGSHYYAAPSLIQNPALNPSITGFDFVDTAGKGTKQWVFRIDLSKANLPVIAGGQTAPTLTLYWLAYQYGALTANSYTTSPVTAGTTAETSNIILYYGSLAATKEANAVSQVEIKINNTSTSNWDAGNSYVQIPNIGPGGGPLNVYLNQMVYTKDSSNVYYDYYLQAPQSTGFMVSGTSMQQNLKGADFVTVGAIGANSVPFTTNIVTNLGSADGYAVTMTISSLDDTQATQTSSKVINLCTSGKTCS